MDKFRKIGLALLKWGAVLLAIAICIAVFGGGKGVEKNPATTSTESARKYTGECDLSKRTEKSIPATIVLPAVEEGKWVKLSLPCFRVDGGIAWYLVDLKPTVPVEYDCGNGVVVKDYPNNEKKVVPQYPAVMDIRATGKSGEVKVLLSQQFLPDPPTKK